MRHLVALTILTLVLVAGTRAPASAQQVFTGHSQRDVCTILDAHYLHRDPEMAWNAIKKLELGMAKWIERGTASSNCAPNWTVVSKEVGEKAS
jgi:hypothetical protein